MLTKYTEVQYDLDSYSRTLDLPYVLYVDECLAKVQEMQSQGKTLELYAQPGTGPHSYKRFWLDQNAAQEWKVFQTQKATEHGFTIVDYIIGDIIVQN